MPSGSQAHTTNNGASANDSEEVYGDSDFEESAPAPSVSVSREPTSQSGNLEFQVISCLRFELSSDILIFIEN